MIKLFAFDPDKIKYEDSFARTTRGKLRGIQSALRKASGEPANTTLLVAHFADTFTQLQDMLHEEAIEYDIATSKLDHDWLAVSRDDQGNVLLTLAELLEPLPRQSNESSTAPSTVSVIVSERHPLLSADERLAEFCKSLPCRVRWGYFLSFQDAVMKALVDKRAVQILDMFGMGQYELIHSKMVSKSLNRALKKMETRYLSRFPTDSAEQWLIRNAKPVEN